MSAPMTPTTRRTGIPSERQYREWQMSLQGNTPVRRFKNEPGLLARWASTLRRATLREPRPVTDLRRIEQAKQPR